MSLVSSPVVFDSSVLINLLAAQQADSIIRALAVPGYVCPAVLEETLYIRSENAGDPPRKVSIEALLKTGVLERIELTDHEAELYVEYSMSLDDGEAMTVAVAESRSLVVATDDKKAKRVAQRDGSSIVEVVSTPMLLHHWNKMERPSADVVRSAINRVEVSARFRPSSAEPLKDWWVSHR